MALKMLNKIFEWREAPVNFFAKHPCIHLNIPFKPLHWKHFKLEEYEREREIE